MPARSVGTFKNTDLHVGAKLRELRMARGLSQMDIADALEKTFQQIQKYERGVNRISASVLYALAQHLGVPITAFFEGLDPTATPTATGRQSDVLAFMKTYQTLSPPARDALHTVAKSLTHVAA